VKHYLKLQHSLVFFTEDKKGKRHKVTSVPDLPKYRRMLEKKFKYVIFAETNYATLIKLEGEQHEEKVRALGRRRSTRHSHSK
jgi:hypothetical protein